MHESRPIAVGTQAIIGYAGDVTLVPMPRLAQVVPISQPAGALLLSLGLCVHGNKVDKDTKKTEGE